MIKTSNDHSAAARALLAWLDGNADLPNRPALITFDDGYRDNLEIAAPLLAERSIQVDARPARGRLRGSATKSGGAAAG